MTKSAVENLSLVFNDTGLNATDQSRCNKTSLMVPDSHFKHWQLLLVMDN